MSGETDPHQSMDMMLFVVMQRISDRLTRVSSEYTQENLRPRGLPVTGSSEAPAYHHLPTAAQVRGALVDSELPTWGKSSVITVCCPVCGSRRSTALARPPSPARLPRDSSTGPGG